MATTQKTGKFRRKKVSFTATSNTVLFDNNLDMDTKTLHNMINYYISIPDFTLYKAHIQKQSGVGQTAFNRMWKQLKERGYLLQYKLKDSKGAFYYEYELLDEPQKIKIESMQPDIHNDTVGKEDAPEVRFTHLDETSMDDSVHGNRTSINKTVINKTIINKTINNKNINKQQQPKEKEQLVVVSCDTHLPTIDEELIDQFKKAFGRKPSIKTQESLISFLSKFDREVLLYAFEIAGGKGKAYDYAQGILRTWWREEAYTFDRVFEYEKKFKERIG